MLENIIYQQLSHTKILFNSTKDNLLFMTNNNNFLLILQSLIAAAQLNYILYSSIK